MITIAREIEIGRGVRLGEGRKLFLIGGPCVIESETHARDMARSIAAPCRELDIPFIFKSSFDKANRSSLSSYRGPGLDRGLEILKGIKKDFNLPVLSDVHETSQIEAAASVLDVLQIPAFLCRQTDLLVEAARTGKALNIKKGPFLSPRDMDNVVDKVVKQGNENIMLTERGTTFGYNALVFDVRSIPLMKKTGFPVIIDASHSVQQPGGQGTFSGGEAEFIPTMARTGIAAGADGLFMEIHDHPEHALSDGHNSFDINYLKEFLAGLVRLKSLMGTLQAKDETAP